MRRAAKRDNSEPEIISVFQKMGFSVYRLNQPVDLLLGYRGKTYLAECKTGRKGYGKALNDNQARFAETWRGHPVITLHGADDAVKWALEIAKG